MTRDGSSHDGSPSRRLHNWLLSPHQLVATSTTRLRVTRGPHGSWIVIDPDRDSPLTQFSTREQALSAATLALEEVRGGRLEIADENGVRDLAPVPVVRRPWWQATKTPRAGLLLGLLWLGLFILRLTTDGRPGWHLESLLLVLSGGLAALYLSTSVVLLLRRRRSHRESESS